MSRSPARLPDRKISATAARPRATRREPAAGLGKVQLELQDGRYLLAYSRATSGDDA